MIHAAVLCSFTLLALGLPGQWSAATIAVAASPAPQPPEAEESPESEHRAPESETEDDSDAFRAPSMPTCSTHPDSAWAGEVLDTSHSFGRIPTPPPDC